MNTIYVLDFSNPCQKDFETWILGEMIMRPELQGSPALLSNVDFFFQTKERHSAGRFVNVLGNLIDLNLPRKWVLFEGAVLISGRNRHVGVNFLNTRIGLISATELTELPKYRYSKLFVPPEPVACE